MPTITKHLVVWGAMVLCLGFLACATPPEPFEYRSSNELKPGPGLFSGEDGRFTLYGNPEAVGEASSESQKDSGTPEDAEPTAP